MDWLGYFVPRLGQRRQIFSSLAPPHEDDVAVLEELKAEGSRLDLPHPVRGFLDFPSEPRARDAMDLLQKDGYKVGLRQETGSWRVTAVTTLVPTPGAITRLREVLGGVAAAYDGVYAGWGAPPVY